VKDPLELPVLHAAPVTSDAVAGPSSLDDLRAFYDHAALSHDAWRARYSLYHEEELGLLQRLVPPGHRVLEVGCAFGDTLAGLSPSVGVGVDISPVMIDKARARYPGLRFEVADAESLDLGGETFDYVVVTGLVGSSRDLWAAFRSLRNVVNETTRVVVTYHNFLWQPALDLAEKAGLRRPLPVQNWFSLDDIENLLTLSGFEAVSQGERVLLPIEVPALTRAANRWGPTVPALRGLCLLHYLVARPGAGFHVRPAPLTTSVIVPARNERGNIRSAIRRITKMGPRTEVLFVEGNSEDGTREEILRAIEDEPSPCELRFLGQPGKGKGDAVRAGFAGATGEVLMILDADLTVIPEDLPRFYLALAERRGDFINGCRLIYQMENQAMRTLNLMGNKFFGAAFSYVLGQRLKDTLCGTKVLLKSDYERIAAARHVFGEQDPFGDFDLLFGAARLGLRIREIPVRYRARTYGETNISRFRHGLMLLRMLRRGFNHFQLP
jgi:SAM-dependent methyltransferase